MSKPYTHAREEYAALGVDTDKAIERALAIPISMHCWQADDITGFEVKKRGWLAAASWPRVTIPVAHVPPTKRVRTTSGL